MIKGEFCLYIFFGILGFFWVSSKGDKSLLEVFFWIWFGAGFPAGLRILEGKFNFFLTLPLIGWVIFIIFKYGTTALIGMFVLPVRTIKNIKRFKELKQIS